MFMLNDSSEENSIYGEDGPPCDRPHSAKPYIRRTSEKVHGLARKHIARDLMISTMKQQYAKKKRKTMIEEQLQIPEYSHIDIK